MRTELAAKQISTPRMSCLKRDSQQRIEPAAIADDVTLCETQATTLITNSIDIDAGREKIRTPVAHDARDQKGRFCGEAIISGFADHRQPDDVAVAVPFVDVCGSQCGNPVVQHCA